MRPYLLVAVLAAATAAGPASAVEPCVAKADGPYTAGANVHGYGTFGCALPAPGMTVTVCVESWRLTLPVWLAESCATRTAPTTTDFVSETGVACVQGGPALVRIAVTGSNADGAYGSAVSAPTWAPGAGSCGP